ncbi:MAG TPA: pilus assembly protein [Noviherbaspirillum sp.]|nr:pilus assembly protein [Noviherbaspirillum sp.]
MRHSFRSRRELGAALIVALMMLVGVLALAVSAAQIAIQAERAARNERDRHVAFQAAEAALLDAEMDIEDGGSRSGLFAHDSIDGFEAGCGTAGDARGLCLRAAAGTPVWLAMDFLDPDSAAVDFGSFTGKSFPGGSGPLPARPPRYLIEVMPFNRAGEGATVEDITYFYRVTAIGFGARDSTQVVLQTFYRKHAQ